MTFVGVSGGPTVWISSLLGLIVAPTAAFQQYKLTQVEALQQTNAVFEVETDKLSRENQKLQQTVQQMEESVLKYVCVSTLSKL